MQEKEDQGILSLRCPLLRVLMIAQCDESRPSCNNCVRHSYECDFANRPAPPPNHIADNNATTSSTLSRSPGTWADGSPILNLPIRHPEPAQSFHLNMVDLELLHNFSTSTSLTFSNELIIKTLWRINVPQIGFSHEFVMR